MIIIWSILKFILIFCYLLSRKIPSLVRLGDQNLLTTDDGAQPVDYLVKSFRWHPDYNQYKKFNDIALIELKTVVIFTEFIRPACLHQGHSDEVYSVIAVSDFRLYNVRREQKISCLDWMGCKCNTWINHRRASKGHAEHHIEPRMHWLLRRGWKNHSWFSNLCRK